MLPQLIARANDAVAAVVALVDNVDFVRAAVAENKEVVVDKL